MRVSRILLLILIPFFTRAQKVISITVDGTINPASASFIHRSLKAAEKENASCLLIHLNTPGGLLKSTRVIVGDIMESPVPVVVYVSPAGAHAGSAGVFVTLAAHIAAMAPGTNMGAAHPVSTAPMDSTMNEKTTNDAVAFIQTIAQKRNRNVTWAEQAVKKSVAIPAADALVLKIIDIISPSTNDLLRQVDGRIVDVNGNSMVMHTKTASVETIEMSFMEKLLNIISDPNIAYILMMLGFYGLLFELYSPGAIFPGIVGVICLILAFYSMHTLPINYAGLALIIFALILFLLEIKVVSHGMLAIGGIISLLLGSFMLIDPNAAEVLRISRSVILTSAAVTTFFFLFIISLGIKAQRAKPVTGLEAIKGETGTVLDSLQPTGSVMMHGEIWKAESIAGNIEKGARVRITSMKNFTLFVEPLNS